MNAKPPITTRSQVKFNWPYNTRQYGIVYRNPWAESQEQMIRKFNEIDDDVMLFISIKTDKHMLLPLASLIDF